MAEIINLDDYRNNCDNCVYHQKPGECGKPGGWYWDHRYRRCISFRRKPKEDKDGKSCATQPPPAVVGANEGKTEDSGSQTEQAREQVTRKMLANGRKPPAGTKENKYHNRKDTRTMPDGTVITFDSMKEAHRFDELLLLRKAGRIRDLRLQVEFTLREAYTTAEGYRVRAIRYKADFTYQDENDRLIVEDVKSEATKTRVYSMKKKLMLEKFNLQIREV